MKKIYIIFLLVMGLFIFSCKTNHFMKMKISPSVDSSVVGLVLRFENAKDTTVIGEAVEKALKDCGIKVMDGIFKDGIYEDAQFKQLFQADSTFISSQPTLTNLN